eukprot:CAMPEP_0171453692 /NCGR_PEP_ID=MMETSP0945-20130129/1291_1 /TAXON_ID=109269 /ORGANISM="Vaucheria litorea, Strain CCMP2940" /LENGTH=228 /DNA_ID=CAMNT_0011978595 /DNA_START=133 /DNA_END=819 /DNA_ORIENTATION=+
MKPNQSMAHKNHGNFIQTKKFSINVSNLSQLGKLLHREVVEEQHALSDAMEDEHNLQKMRGKIEDNGFEIIDLTGQASVKLTKKVNEDESITVEFNVLNETNDDKSMDFEGEGEENDDDSVAIFEFNVTVNKNGNLLKFACNAGDNIHIRNIDYYPVGSPDPSNLAFDNIYHGPEFDELEPDLQETFHTYLQDKGIGKDMAEFICMYSDMKEQKEYVKWLQNVRNFVH